MRKLVAWVDRVPWGVWVFLAATQALNVYAASDRLAGLERSLARRPAHPFWDGHREACVRMAQKERTTLTAAVILGPAFLALACRRSARDRFERMTGARTGGSAPPALPGGRQAVPRAGAAWGTPPHTG